MGDQIQDAEDTISHSDLQFVQDLNIVSGKVYKPNQTSSSCSSSSSSSFEQDFIGFFSEEWSRDPSHNTSPKNIIFCGKIVSSKPGTSSKTSVPVRSNSDSFRIMKTASSQSSTPRSKSLPHTSLLSSSLFKKSKWQVFMFGFGSGKFPTTMDMSDIKSRQLRRQSTVSVHGEKDKNNGRRSGKKGWWRLVDVLGCNNGYEKDTMVVI